MMSPPAWQGVAVAVAVAVGGGVEVWVLREGEVQVHARVLFAPRPSAGLGWHRRRR